MLQRGLAVLAGGLMLGGLSARPLEAQEFPPGEKAVTTRILLRAVSDTILEINDQPVALGTLAAQLQMIYSGRPNKVLHVEFCERLDPKLLIVLADAAVDLGLTLIPVAGRGAHPGADAGHPRVLPHSGQRGRRS